MPKLYTPEHLAFCHADAVWGAAVERAFGKDAGTARYQPRGKGEPGSHLQRLYDIRTMARLAWDATDSTLRAQAYRDALARADALQTEWKDACKAAQVFPRGPNGLTPDDVKFSPEYRAAKARTDSAFQAMRAFNVWFTRVFKAEYRVTQRERIQARRKAIA